MMQQPSLAFLPLCFALLANGCATPKSIPQAKTRPPALGGMADTVSGSVIVSKNPKTSQCGKGLLADYDDRDGDGIFEEAHRGDTTYFDRNGDRLADLVVREVLPFHYVEWDADLDGRLDHSATYEEGYVHGLILTGSNSKPAPRLFLEDRIQKTSSPPLASPGWHFWESILQLK